MARLVVSTLIVLLFCFQCVVFSDMSYEYIRVPSLGPISIAFDLCSDSAGLYMSVSDGRILKYSGTSPFCGIEDFAYTSPTRNKAVCDGTNGTSLGCLCGKPLDLALDHTTKELYITDAYYGLCKVGAGGGPATQLATSAEGLAFGKLEGIDVDPQTGLVYFVDSVSAEITESKAEDASGRLLKYDPGTKQVTVLAKELLEPRGVAVAQDGSFVLVSEHGSDRIMKYWLKGPNAATIEPSYELVSMNRLYYLKRTTKGEFWVAGRMGDQGSSGLKLNEWGTDAVNFIFGIDKERYSLITVSGFNEHPTNRYRLYLTSAEANFIGILKLPLEPEDIGDKCSSF